MIGPRRNRRRGRGRPDSARPSAPPITPARPRAGAPPPAPPITPARPPAGAPEAAPTAPTAAPEPEAGAQAPVEEAGRPRLRCEDRLGRARGLLAGYLDRIRGRKGIDDATFEQLEEALILADVGVATTTRVLDDLRAKLRNGALSATDPAALLAGAAG